MRVLSIKNGIKNLFKRGSDIRIELSIGKILDQTFALFTNQIAMIFLLGLFSIAIPHYLLVSTKTLPTALYYMLKFFFWLVDILFIGMATLVCRDWYLGTTISWKNAFSQIIKQLHRLVGAWILMCLAIGLGTICFIIPGILIALSLACFVPIWTIENCSTDQSWTRSGTLVKGCRFQILLLYVTCAIIQLIISFVPTICLSYIINDIQLVNKLAGILTAPIWPLYPFASTFLYYQLREKKEGLDLDDTFL